jgi:hypothetical protein
LLEPCELQENRRELVLRVVRQGGHGLNGLLEKARYEANIVRSRDGREGKGLPNSDLRGRAMRPAKLGSMGLCLGDAFVATPKFGDQGLPIGKTFARRPKRCLQGVDLGS